MAPEFQLQRAKMDSKVDVWAIGCITYYIFQGNHAFMAKKVDQLRRQIKHGQPDYRRLNRIASASAIDFMKICLEKQPAERASARDLLSHEWLQDSFLKSANKIKSKDYKSAMQNLSQAPRRDNF